MIDTPKKERRQMREGETEIQTVAKSENWVRKGGGADFHVDKNCKNLHTLAELKNILCFARSNETWKNF